MLIRRQDKDSRLTVAEMDSNLTYLEDLALNNNNNNNYLVYTALVTQTGTGSTPSATVLQNTIGDLTWEYVSPGLYELKSDSAFVAGKTFLNNQVFHLNGSLFEFDPNDPNVIPFYFAFLTRTDINTIQLAVNFFFLGPETPADGLLTNHSLEVRVYL
jgi:hypothetical protein